VVNIRPNFEIGSAGVFCERLDDYPRGIAAEGRERVRFCLIRDGWRWVEQEPYRKFCEILGAPPLANRMGPWNRGRPAKGAAKSDAK